MTHKLRSLALMMALGVGSGAHAAEPPVSKDLAATSDKFGTDQAAALLSRFPAGRVPTNATVLGALDTLQEAGAPEHLPLLRCLSDEERGAVRHAATNALQATLLRKRQAQRTAFSNAVPQADDVDAWLRSHQRQLNRADGTVLGRTERRMVAYAALVLGPPSGHSMLQPVPPGDTDALLDKAQTAENQTNPQAALALYAQAAASGNIDAITQIASFGVDIEPLILGMTASPRVGSTPQLDPASVETLVSNGGETTITVLLERTHGQAHIERAVALDALGTMLQSRHLSAVVRTEAIRAIDAATRDPRPAMREAAISTLAEARVYQSDEW